MRNFKNLAFTLIELILVIMIMGIIFSGALAFSRSSLIGSQLDTITLEIKQALLMARSQSRIKYKNLSAGVYFEAEKFVIFRGNSYEEAASDNQVTFLPGNLTISNIDLQSANAIIFAGMSGDPNVFGSITISGDDGRSSVVSVAENGIINVDFFQ